MEHEKMTKVQLIEELEQKEKKLQEKAWGTLVKDNVFTSEIIWDGQAIEAINNVSQALLNLTHIFESQNINMTALSIRQDQVDKKSESVKSENENIESWEKHVDSWENDSPQS